MATVYNPNSRDAVWLRSLGYSLQGHRKRGMCVVVWWKDLFGRIGPEGIVYTQGYVVLIERNKRRTDKLQKGKIR